MFNNYKSSEKKLTELELLATFIFTISIFISLSLVYNKYLKYNQKNFYSDELERKISILNRIIVVFVSFGYLYINIQNKKINQNNKNLFDLQISASTLATIAALIVLYVVINDNNYNIVGIENPAL